MKLKPIADRAIILKSPAELRVMREAGLVVARTVRELIAAMKPGMTTRDLDNLAAALASVGATLDQVGALRLYIKQSHMGEGRAISAALRAKFGDNPPCSTWIGVTGLADEQFLIEVEPSVVFLD